VLANGLSESEKQLPQIHSWQPDPADHNHDKSDRNLTHPQWTMRFYRQSVRADLHHSKLLLQPCCSPQFFPNAVLRIFSAAQTTHPDALHIGGNQCGRTVQPAFAWYRSHFFVFRHDGWRYKHSPPPCSWRGKRTADTGPGTRQHLPVLLLCTTALHQTR